MLGSPRTPNSLLPLVKGLAPLFCECYEVDHRKITHPIILGVFIPKAHNGRTNHLSHVPIAKEAIRDKYAVSRILNLWDQDRIRIAFLEANGEPDRADSPIGAVYSALDKLCDLEGDREYTPHPLAEICRGTYDDFAASIEENIIAGIRSSLASSYDAKCDTVETFDREIGLLIEDLKSCEANKQLTEGGSLPRDRWKVLRYLCACGIAGPAVVGEGLERNGGPLGGDASPASVEPLQGGDRLVVARKTLQTASSSQKDRRSASPSTHLYRMGLVNGLQTVVEDFAFGLDVQSIAIGVNLDNDIAIDGAQFPFVSDHHAVIKREGDGWTLVHLSATNKTVVVCPDGKARVLTMPNSWARVEAGSTIALAPWETVTTGGKVKHELNYDGGAVFAFNAL